MPNMQKVIKGFECCHVMVHDLGPDKSSCGICPYKDVQTEEQIDLGGIECIAVLHDDALALLKEQGTIVRCKDCKYWYFADNRIPCEQENVCGRNGIVVTPDWFCADGERKD